MNKMMDNFKKSYRSAVDSWTDDYNQIVRKWGIAKREYNRKEKQYLETTFDLASMSQPLMGSQPLQAPVTDDPLAGMEPGDFLCYSIGHGVTYPKSGTARHLCSVYRHSRG